MKTKSELGVAYLARVRDGWWVGCGLKISIDVAASWLFLCSGPKRRPHLAPKAAGAIENVRHATP